MVKVHDYEVKLVEATTREPFVEYEKNSCSYIECKPGLEYFVSLQKISNQFGPTCCKIFVDDQDLDYYVEFRRETSHPVYKGLRSCSNGITTHQAFKFFEPNGTVKGLCRPSVESFAGKVEICIYDATLGSGSSPEKEKNSTLYQMPNCTPSYTPIKKSRRKSAVRSAFGSACIHDAPAQATYVLGQCLKTITLYYSTEEDLKNRGVLTSPVQKALSSPAQKGRTKKRKNADDSLDRPTKRSRTLSPKIAIMQKALSSPAQKGRTKKRRSADDSRDRPTLYPKTASMQNVLSSPAQKRRTKKRRNVDDSPDRPVKRSRTLSPKISRMKRTKSNFT